MGRLKRWATYDAAPWQFWYPQSGAPGGMIAAMILLALVFAFGILPP